MDDFLPGEKKIAFIVLLKVSFAQVCQYRPFFGLKSFHNLL